MALRSPARILHESPHRLRMPVPPPADRPAIFLLERHTDRAANTMRSQWVVRRVPESIRTDGWWLSDSGADIANAALLPVGAGPVLPDPVQHAVRGADGHGSWRDARRLDRPCPRRRTTPNTPQLDIGDLCEIGEPAVPAMME